MENTIVKLDRTIIHNPTDSVCDFIKEWNSGKNYVIAHTSGSTGKPKPIKLDKSDMYQSALLTCQKFNITQQSCLLLPLSADYIAGKMMIVRALVSGAELWVERPSNAPITQNYGRIDLLPIVPSQIESVLGSPYLKQIKNIIVGGAAIHNETENKISRSEINAFATYGMTETCSHVALRQIGTGGVYEALKGISFRIDNRQCLIIDAPQFKYKTLTTNDIVNLIDPYHFEWLGRYDNVINSGGIKIFPEQLEKLFSRYINTPFYVIGMPDEKWGEVVALYIESDKIDIAELKDKLSKVVSNRYHLPQKIICVEKFQRTTTNKVIRKIL